MRLERFMLLALLATTLFLTGCTKEAWKSPVSFAQALLGYTPPPSEATVLEELRFEYRKCVQLKTSDNCMREAYRVVQDVKGLDPTPIPEGQVIIRDETGKELEPQATDGSDVPEDPEQ